MLTNPAFNLLFGFLLLVLVSWLFWPESGVYWRWQKQSRLTDRVLIEDALKHIYTFEVGFRSATLESLAGALSISLDKASRVLDITQQKNLVKIKGDQFLLTPTGKETALQILRAHRLWEKYLAEFSGFQEQDWHSQAEQLEHHLTREEMDRISARLGHPTHDPHGDPIPTAAGKVVEHGGVPLTDLAEQSTARIVHIEDEPEMVYAQILAEKLHPGMMIRLDEMSPARVRIWSEGGEHILAPIVARNLSVVPLKIQTDEEGEQGVPLSSLQQGQWSRIVQISSQCRRVQRRRLLDLGVIPGTEIKAELVSPGGDPTAYRIRGTVIALRDSQAKLIRITPLDDDRQI
ncbi:MAG: iron dependent repressor, metal binding and dimerization domain protein [Anaerolineales bacterium]|nr:iron dependent repressor, metal binding and dimerization domain protein [Anaerolineales bacterium]